MKIVLNILLTAAVAGLVYLLYVSIAEPIQFKDEWSSRERKVGDQLEDVRVAQIAFKDIVGYYAPNFDTLAQVLRTENFKIKTTIGDPDDPKSNFREFITESPAIDSMNAMGINLDSIGYVPYGNGEKFTIVAKILPEYQSAKNIAVISVYTPVETYMGPWGDARFNRYDAMYNPKAKLFFGNLEKPSTDGNWRK
jgi:hypothetical protein